MLLFGEGIPAGSTLGGTQFKPLAGALDAVAHEMAHGLTDYSSRLIYRNESGALNEAFSDIVATGAEFFYHAPGQGAGRADYLIGEDVAAPSLRSMADPRALGDPDHYSARYRGTDDNGGVHWNSGIANHAFYLAIEGGTNRTSGLAVEGVGAADREQIEKVFYRAFVYFLTADATFFQARLATIQSARELYGAGSPAERAITQAWTAVGVY
jgi:thermolysin